MENKEGTISHEYPVERKQVLAVTEEISDLLRQAFERHKTVCKGHQKVEDELRRTKRELARASEDSLLAGELARENLDLKDELAEANSRIASLAKRNEHLQNEVNYWHRQAVSANTADSKTSSHSTIPDARVFAQRQLKEISPKQNREVSSSATASKTHRDGHQPMQKNPVSVVTLHDDDEPNEEITTFASRTVGAVKRTHSPNDDTHTPPRQALKSRPLQTNTCKACQTYWRVEDSRKPGELKLADVPYCKIHGKNRRPPNTPENYWKQARLTNPDRRDERISMES